MSTVTTPQKTKTPQKTETPETEPDYAMPPVRVLDRVLVSSTMPFRDPLPAYVVAISDGAVDLMVLQLRKLTFYDDCLHITDPRLNVDASIINDNPDRGVFKLAPAEEDSHEGLALIKALADRASSLEATVAELAKQVAALQRKAK